MSQEMCTVEPACVKNLALLFQFSEFNVRTYDMFSLSVEPSTCLTCLGILYCYW
jgi:hypothetical protein